MRPKQPKKEEAERSSANILRPFLDHSTLVLSRVSADAAVTVRALALCAVNLRELQLDPGGASPCNVTSL